MALDSLDLTDDELEQLKSDGLIDPDWTPSPTEGDEVDTGEVDSPLSGELVLPEDGETPPPAREQQSPLAQVGAGTELLGQYEQESPVMQDPAIKRFSDIALRWLPTDDKQLQTARADAQKAADQLAALRVAAEKATTEYPWDVFAAEMFAPKVPLGYTAALGTTMRAVNAEKVRRQKVAQDLGLKEAEATAQRARQAETGEISRVSAAANLTQAAAQMQRYSNAFKKQTTTGSAFGKRMAELGIDIRTPEGQKAARRVWVLEQAKGDPVAVQAVLSHPDMDPFTPEFAEAVAGAHLDASKKKEAVAAAKEARQVRKDDVTIKAQEASIEANKARVEQIRKKIDDAQGAGKIMSPTAINGLLENQANLRKAQLALGLVQGKDTGGQKGDKAATGWKGYIPDVALQRIDPKGVPTRAALADLRSGIIHSLSGAAVTPSEYKRLEPLIPKDTDDPSVAANKLTRFVAEYELIIAEKADVYHEAGYRVPTHALKGIEEMGNLKTGKTGSNVATGTGGEVRRNDPKTGKTAIFNADTKKFIRWE